MSRCFPYPPPGYTLSTARNEALIESIKLQKEKERKKEKKEKRKETKERRKEKKEKRKEKKERRKEKKDKADQNLDKPDTKNDHHVSDKSDIESHHTIPRSSLDTKVDFFPKKRDSEAEQLERSNLTEEHARPVSLSGPSTSSDSTENSGKRKRHSLPIDDTCGKVILIRLPSKKQNEFDALTKEESQLCSTSGRTDPPARCRDVNPDRDLPANTLKVTSDVGQGFDLRNNTEQQVPANTLKVTSDVGQGFDLRNNTEQQVCSTSGQIKGRTLTKPTPKPVVLTPMQKMHLEYLSLFDNRFGPLVQEACLHSDDLDWLLKDRKQDDQETRAEKKRRFESDGSNLSCSRSSGLWPRAEYMHEVDMYALPFTVPY